MTNRQQLLAARYIFSVIWAKTVPNWFLEDMIQLINNHEYQLKVIPFHQLKCKADKIYKSERDRGTNLYECGYWESIYDEEFFGFEKRRMNHGKHWNLHKVLHCLHDLGIGFDKIKIEERFRGGIVDVEAEIEKEKQYVVVELGELSSIGKFSLVEDKIVKEFWFGDKEKFIYSLSKLM